MNVSQPFIISLIVLPRSILANMAILDSNLKIGLCTTLIKVKVKVFDTYGVIASSPKQFDLDISEARRGERCVCVYGLVSEVMHF